MMKKVKAVKPFIYENNSNFKLAVYQKWKECGGAVVRSEERRVGKVCR